MAATVCRHAIARGGKSRGDGKLLPTNTFGPTVPFNPTPRHPNWEVTDMTLPRFLVASMLVAGAATLCSAAPVVSNEYENFDTARGGTDVPVTLSRIGAAGDFTKGITPAIGGKKLPAQVDVLRRADDRSIRHALVSFVLPALPAGGTVKIDWLNEAPPAPPAFVWGFDRAKLSLALTLQPVEGAPLVSDITKHLGADWGASQRVSILHDGPVMKEFEIRDVPIGRLDEPDPLLEVIWRLRVFTGQKSIRIAAVVENCKEWRAGLPWRVHWKFKDATLRCGGKVLAQTGPYDHLDRTRFRLLVWSDGAIEDLHRRPNYAYWVKGKFVPLWRKLKNFTAADVDRKYTTKRWSYDPKTDDRILGKGIIYRQMPGTGGRADIGPYPEWVACYLLAGGPRTYRAILHADGDGGGAFYIHVRQNGMPGFNVKTQTRAPKGKRQMPSYQLPVQPDHAHTPSLGYISYLLTGDRYYAEELSFWASYHLGGWPYIGLRHNYPARGQAWGLRQVADAAFLLPTTDPLQGYYTREVRAYLKRYEEGYMHRGRKLHYGPDVTYSSGRMRWINATFCSTWQYAWLVWSFHNAVDRGFPEAAKIRDWTGEYIVGFYTSDDEFTGPDGKVYRYDPRDAMCYSTPTALLETKIVTKGDRREIVPGRRIRNIDNYGEVWYYTKLNEDNAWSSATGGLKTSPDADGNWPLKEAGGWGHGNKKSRGWHRYGGWIGIVSALEANVPNARRAYETMYKLAGPTDPRDPCPIEMVPRIKGFTFPAGK